jgi:hypothetical protein
LRRFCFPLLGAVVIFWEPVLGAEITVAVGTTEWHVGFDVALLAFQIFFTWLVFDDSFEL